ncbi:hypothetical protein NKH77_01230 [Streptomyces sp. M19]
MIRTSATMRPAASRSSWLSTALTATVMAVTIASPTIKVAAVAAVRRGCAGRSPRRACPERP